MEGWRTRQEQLDDPLHRRWGPLLDDPAVELERLVDEMRAALDTLERRDVITSKREDADECCGQPRDDDGFCVYRPGHPIYVAR